VGAIYHPNKKILEKDCNFIILSYNKSRENPTFTTGGIKMLAKTFIDNAKVMAKGQVTIPKDVRDVLGVSSGDRVSFVVEGSSVRIVNSAIYAMQLLQSEMQGEAERTGLTSDEAVADLVKELREEEAL
jgi:AbrB family looped-hinge helix DNA binding protein